MANNVQIKFDIDNKSLKIAGEETMRLTTLVRTLKAELASGKYSQEEFDILSNKLDDVQERMEATRARSGDLLTSLQLIPGPIGEIASKFNGAISVLQQFSRFSLSDIQTQFKKTIDDVSGIASSIGKATGITRVYGVVNEFLAGTFVKVGIAEGAAATGARAFAAALTATGIGALIVLLGTAVSALMEFATGTEEAERKQKKFNDSLEETNELLDLDLSSAKRRQNERLATLKKDGASEKEIRDQNLKDLKENLQLTENALVEALKKEDEAQNVSAEAVTAAQANSVKLEKTTKDLKSAIRVAEIDNIAQSNQEKENLAKEAQGKAQKAEQSEKQFQQERLKNQKDALDAQIELEVSKGNTSLKELETLYKKRNQFDLDELNNAETNAKNLLAKGKINRDEYNTIIGGIEAKRVLLTQKTTEAIKKAGEEDKKVQDETIKNTEDYNRKIRDLRTSAILDDTERERQARLDKYSDDLAALEQDKEFITRSEEDKAEIRKNLKIILNKDLDKINENQSNKEYEDEQKATERKLRLLELQGQALINGTRSYFENRRAILDETEKQELAALKLQLDTDKITREEYQKQVTATEEKYTKLRKDQKKQELAALGQSISATIDAFAGLTGAIASLYNDEAKTSEKAFEQRKKLQIATAVMSAASGLVQILTQPSTLPSPFDVIVKTANAVALGISTKVNIDKIKATKFESPDSKEDKSSTPTPYSVSANRASGGIVTGAGTSTSDSINARLSNGEYVVNAKSTKAFLPLLNSMNDAGLQPRFATGGIYNPQESSSLMTNNITRAIQESIIDRPVKTYVVGTDMSNQQQFDRTIKSRSIV
jgi:hypothetical protein